MAKIKEIEIDGENFKIGKFNCLQVEEIIERGVTEDVKEMTDRMWSTIATGLENGGDSRVTQVRHKDDGVSVPSGSIILGTKRLKISMSLEQRDTLHREILEFSGLTVKPAGE